MVSIDHQLLNKDEPLLVCGFETLKRRQGQPCIRESIEEKAESHWRPYLALFSYLLRIVLLWFVKHIVKDVCFARYIKIGSSASSSNLSSWLEETNNKMKTNVLFFYISRLLVEHKTLRIGHSVPFSVVSSYSNRTTDGLDVRKIQCTSEYTGTDREGHIWQCHRVLLLITRSVSLRFSSVVTPLVDFCIPQRTC